MGENKKKLTNRYILCESISRTFIVLYMNNGNLKKKKYPWLSDFLSCINWEAVISNNRRLASVKLGKSRSRIVRVSPRSLSNLVFPVQVCDRQTCNNKRQRRVVDEGPYVKVPGDDTVTPIRRGGSCIVAAIRNMREHVNNVCGSLLSMWRPFAIDAGYI